ncbi:MAG: DUF2189 domain-containing protein [Sneathiella sp.]|nr:DUF2189 domain-containing protein [Sneathiella sp.]
MATNKTAAETKVASETIEIREIGSAEILDSLKLGIADFNKKPTHYLFLILTYPILMVLIARVYAGYDILPMLFPIIAGSTLLGPVAACGMYELSRRMERGLDSSWTHVFDVFRSPSILAIVTLGVVLGVIFVVWLSLAELIYFSYFGDVVPESLMGFVSAILTTPAGWGLIVTGTITGLIFAVLVLIISVISFPLLLDRRVSAMTAASASFRAVAMNPKSMAVWGFIVALGLVLGAIPLFLGLSVVMPVLGHATWHLYRKVIVS